MNLSKHLGAALALASGGLVQAQTYTSIQVDSTDNLSGAGNPTNTTPNPGGGSGGTAASGYSIDPGTGRVLTFQSVAGIVSLSFPVVSTNADGVDPLLGGAAFGLGHEDLAREGYVLSQRLGFQHGASILYKYRDRVPEFMRTQTVRTFDLDHNDPLVADFFRRAELVVQG